MNLSVRNIVIGVIILVLAVAIPVTIKLAQQRQTLQSRANEDVKCEGIAGQNDRYCMRFDNFRNEPITVGDTVTVFVGANTGDASVDLSGTVFTKDTKFIGAGSLCGMSETTCWKFEIPNVTAQTYTEFFNSIRPNETIKAARVHHSFTPVAVNPPSPAPSTSVPPAAEKITIGGVIRKPDNTPVRGAEINKGVADPPNCIIGVSPPTGDDGRYTFTNIVSKGQAFCLRLTCPAGYNPVPLSRENPPSSSYERQSGEQANKTDFDFTCTLASPAPSTPGNVGVGTPMTIKGRVTDSNNNSVGGIKISVYNDSKTGKPTLTDITDNDGKFSISNFVTSTDNYAVRTDFSYGNPVSGYSGVSIPPGGAYEQQGAGGNGNCNESCNFKLTNTDLEYNADWVPPITIQGDGKSGNIDNFPGGLTAGKTYQITMTMQNTSSPNGQPWTTSYKLQALPPTNTDSGLNLSQTSISPTFTVSKGDQYPFTVTIRPDQGDHAFRWRMVNDRNSPFGALINVQLQVSNPGGGGTGTAPTVTDFTADPASGLRSGQNVTLRWKITGTVDRCVGTGWSYSGTPVTGDNFITITPSGNPGANLILGLVCYNGNNASPQITTVLRYAAETGAPVVNLSPSSTNVNSNESFNLNWTVTPGTGDSIENCNASTNGLPAGITSPWTGSVGSSSSGSRSITINNTTANELNLTFSLTCTGTLPPSRSNSATAQVTIRRPAAGGGTCSMPDLKIKFRDSNNTGNWFMTKTIKIGESLRVAAFHGDQTETIAPDIARLITTGPSYSNTMNNGEFFRADTDLEPGQYSFEASITGSQGTGCKSQIIVNSAGGSSPSPSPSPSSSPSPVRKTLCFAFAEGDAGRSAVNAVTTTDAAKYCNDNVGNGLVFRYNREPVEFRDRPFGDPAPGTKTFFVKFIGLENNVTKVSPLLTQSITYNPGASITTASCTSKKDTTGTDITISGSHFGALGEKSLLKVGNTEATIDEWKADTITAHIDNRIDGKNNISLTLASGIELKTNCTVNTNTVRFTTALQCRPAGTYAISDVSIKVYETLPISTRALNPDPIHEQKISIDNSGNPLGFAPKFERGKKYQLIIKAPGTLAKKVEFNTERAGTVSLNNDTPVLLKQGDISPKAAADGVINSFDKQELIRQWSIVTDVSRTGDLNQDGRINSIDYACMRLNSNSSDDKYSPLTVLPSPSGGAVVPSSSPGVSSSSSPSSSPAPSVAARTFTVTFNNTTQTGTVNSNGLGSVTISSLQQGQNLLQLTYPGATTPIPIFVYYFPNGVPASPSPSANASPSPSASASPVSSPSPAASSRVDVDPPASPSPSPATSASPSPSPSPGSSPVSLIPLPQAFKKVFATGIPYNDNPGGIV